MVDQLTDRQRRFLAFFLDRSSRGFLCATRSAALAGYTHPGKQGPRLTTMPHIRRAIETEFRRLAAESIPDNPRWLPRGGLVACLERIGIVRSSCM